MICVYIYSTFIQYTIKINMLQCYEKEEIAQANVNLSFFGHKCSVAEMLRRMLIGYSRMMYMA